MASTQVNAGFPTQSGLCAIYTRISSDPTGQQLGVLRQLDECKALAERQGWPAQLVFSDNDISASGKVQRPGYLALLDSIASGQVTALVVWHPDRLHRSPRELEGFIDLVERQGTQVATVTAGAYDLTTPSGRMVARIVGATARYEGEQKAARQKAQRLQTARQGKPSHQGRYRTFGYSADGLSLVPQEADALRWMASEIRSGTTGTQVLRQLDAKGITTTSGGPFRLSTLSRLLTLPRLAGYRLVDGEVFHGTWPAVFTLEEHAELVAIYDYQARRPTQKAIRSLLIGMATCGRCGAKLSSGATTNRVAGKLVRHKLYWCRNNANTSGCDALTIRQANADEAARALAIEAALSARLPDAEAKERLEALEHAHYVERTLSAERFAELAESLRLKTATTELDDLLRGVRRTPAALGKAWDANPLAWRRQLLEALCCKVEVRPALKRGRGSNALDRLTLHPH